MATLKSMSISLTQFLKQYLVYNQIKEKSNISLLNCGFKLSICFYYFIRYCPNIKPAK